MYLFLQTAFKHQLHTTKCSNILKQFFRNSNHFVELALKGLMHTKTRGLKGYVYNNKKNSKTTTTKKTCKGINFTQIVV